MNNLYIKIGFDGCNQVKVLRRLSLTESELIWFFDLDGDRHIEFAEFYSDSHFILMDDQGWLRTFDLDSREQILNVTLNATRFCSARISNDGAHFDVCYDDQHDRAIYGRMRLDNFEQVRLQVLPDGIDTRFFHECADGRLFFYINHWISKHDHTEHGFIELDPVSEATKKHELGILSESVSMVHNELHPIFSQLDQAILPCWDAIEVEQGETNFYLYKVDIVDLNTLKKESVCIRKLKRENLGFDDDDCDNRSQLFLSGDPDSEDYQDAQVDVYEKLDCRYLQDNYLWIVWHGGYLRRLNLCDLSLSPLVVPTGNGETFLANRDFDPDTMYFYPKIVHHDDTALLMRDNRKHWRLPFSDLALDQSAEFETKLEWSQVETKQIKPENFDQLKQLMSHCHIQVGDINQDEQLREALIVLADNFDIDQLRRGDKLSFIFSDTNGNTLDEKSFFERIEKISGCESALSKIIETFIAHPDAPQLYIHEEAWSLAYATLALGKASPQHLDLALKHLTILDFDHDVVFGEHVQPELIRHYSGSDTQHKLRLAFAMTTSQWAEEWLCETFEDSDSDAHAEFRQWLEQSDKNEIKNWIRHCYSCGLKANHLLETINERLQKPELAALFKTA